ncbi:phosphodiester glycosidase family protein [Cellulosilyticum sp. I15G10I2]|uniref:phosphodiester glycosidase family protein n=1 Tax=Cellulosilyticum sp. I15G10I2 TaxID=1892843 RepID=UPI00085CD4C4|nr:phosphodiester glycosidase family protein [Cellulosilyticum sp. I15G10I2]
MKLKSKIISSLIIAAALSVNVYGTVLHKEKTEQMITRGATLIKEQILTGEGWQSIQILKVNLQDENIKLKPIESTTLGERRTILDLVNQSGAIAGINADFFDTATSNTPSFGPVIADGELKHAYNSNYSTIGIANNMATFLIDTGNNPLIDYYGTSVMLYVNDLPIGGMAAYNNIPTTLSRPIVLDYTYERDTSKALARFKGVYTAVIENNEVTYLSKQDEVVAIPRNGYVVLINTNDANAYYSKLPVGTKAEIQKTIYLNNNVTQMVEDIKLGVGGSGIIMKNGEEFSGASHKVTPATRAPRTVIATLKQSSEILLIAIDGRNKTLGANHKDLVTLLKSYGVQDAMYFDGGGSTTLVARNEAEAEVKLQNTPSDGAQRRVVNGIGVFTTQQTGHLSRLYLDATTNRAFVGEPITFSVKGTDKNYNPVNVASSNVKMIVSGVAGTFNGFTFYPETAGKALVIVNSNGIEAAKEIYISDKPAGIRIEPSNLQIAPNSSKVIQIFGVDKEGYKLPLTADKVTWTSNSEQVSGKGNQITAAQKSLALLTASYKGVSANLGVIVGDTAVPIESFEKNSAVWGGNTTTVQGKVEPSKEFKYHGDTAIKMSYTFAKTANKQVAYTIFSQPIEIPADAMSINMWVYARKQGDTAKIEVVDAKGAKFYLKLADSLNFEGWKYLSVILPQTMTAPAKITKFYTYANSVSEKRTSVVYIDHVSITRGFRNREGIALRDDYRFDPYYKPSLQPSVGNQYAINIIGPTKTNSMVLSKETITSIGHKLSQNASMLLFASGNNIELPISIPTYTYANAYTTVDHNNTRVIFAGTDKGGLRVTELNAWLNIKKDIEGTAAKNIILIMSKNPLTQFDDIEEGKALHKYLKTQREMTGKNIFVVYAGGTERETQIEDGIRYIRNNGLVVASDNVQDSHYLQFKVVGNEIYYTFVPFK